jgi:hypothetical protein
MMPLLLEHAHIVYNQKISVLEHLPFQNFGTILKQSQRELNGTSQEELFSLILMVPPQAKVQIHGLLHTSSIMIGQTVALLMKQQLFLLPCSVITVPK